MRKLHDVLKWAHFEIPYGAKATKNPITHDEYKTALEKMMVNIQPNTIFDMSVHLMTLAIIVHDTGHAHAPYTHTELFAECDAPMCEESREQLEILEKIEPYHLIGE